METIRKIKLAHGRDEKSIGQIARNFNLSRNTVRKVLWSDATRFEYHRKVQPMPKMEGFTDWVVEQLKHDAKQPKKYRCTAKPVRLMAGFLILKQLDNLSEEYVAETWVQNPYFQAFCGQQRFDTGKIYSLHEPDVSCISKARHIRNTSSARRHP
ncbi:Transposase domain [Desulfomicrobium norvegicum]|uniref:Transposase domain n=1 Tax=Desulfomicrobium norvegicum (strain DSM 1741 / NCIMB 8310) TaxID=52561 RepID=A0A8G2C3Z3_DESNO|nr:Transposase domain [Desulfomicrobium norvegicum]